MKRNIQFISFVSLLSLFIISCRKHEGPGGKASIKGKLYVKDFNSSNTAVISEYYSAGETVYIIYGEDPSVGNTVKTSFDGSFEFRYLEKGNYKVFALSKDTSIHVSGSGKTDPVTVNVSLTGKKEIKNLNDIIINK